jgi:hypothetical protein
MRQRQAGDDRSQRQVAASRKAEGGDDHARGEYRQTRDTFGTTCVKREAARDGDDGDDVQRDGVGCRVDDDGRRLRHVVRVPHESDQDNDRVGEPRDHCAGGEAGHHHRGASRRADDIDQDQSEQHRLQQIGSIQAQSGRSIGSGHDGDRASHHEQQARQHVRAAPHDLATVANCFHHERRDREEDGVLQQRCGVEADMPPDGVRGSERARDRTQRGGQTVGRCSVYDAR